MAFTVKGHKGYIDVYSTEGKGTTFNLYFPVTREESEKDKSLISIEDYIGKIGIAVRAELDQAGFSKPPSMEKNNAMISA